MNLQITITPDDHFDDVWYVSAAVTQGGVNYASTGPIYSSNSWIEVENKVAYLLKTGHEALKEQIEAAHK